MPASRLCTGRCRCSEMSADVFGSVTRDWKSPPTTSGFFTWTSDSAHWAGPKRTVSQWNHQKVRIFTALFTAPKLIIYPMAAHPVVFYSSYTTAVCPFFALFYSFKNVSLFFLFIVTFHPQSKLAPVIADTSSSHEHLPRR